MNQQRKPDSADTPYRSLHLSPEELIQLPPDELLEACLQMRRLLDLIMGVLSTPDSTLIMRAVTLDLLSARGRTPLAAAGSRRRVASHLSHQDREPTAGHTTGFGAASL
jgi:hypothetical protein